MLGEFICFTVFKTSLAPFVFTGTYEIDPKDLEIDGEIGRGQFFVLGEFICFILFKISPDTFGFTGTYQIDPKDLEIGAEIGRGHFGVSRPTVSSYSLSDLSLANSFFLFFPQKVCFCLPNLANLLGALPRVCINIFSVSTPQNVDFAH